MTIDALIKWNENDLINISKSQINVLMVSTEKIKVCFFESRQEVIWRCW